MPSLRVRLLINVAFCSVGVMRPSSIQWDLSLLLTVGSSGLLVLREQGCRPHGCSDETIAAERVQKWASAALFNEVGS